jgi:acyl-coenzyme A synthetase/AMP-(fatty) acid ligase
MDYRVIWIYSSSYICFFARINSKCFSIFGTAPTRQQYHQRIAQVLEKQFPEIMTTQPELVAHHYTEAGISAQAVLYWQEAGQRAIERSAHVEAIAHLR